MEPMRSPCVRSQTCPVVKNPLQSSLETIAVVVEQNSNGSKIEASAKGGSHARTAIGPLAAHILHRAEVTRHAAIARLTAYLVTTMAFVRSMDPGMPELSVLRAP